jgi:hypothetical protein
MLEDHRQIVKAQVAAHLRARQQALARMPAPEPRISNAMLLASPFGKLPQDASLAAHTTGRSTTLAPGNPAPPAPPQEPDLWMSGMATVLGVAVLLSALRSVWE